MSQWPATRASRVLAALLRIYIPGMVACAVIGGTFNWLLDSELPASIAIISWFAACLVLYFRLIAFRCPRGGHRFFVAWFGGWGVWSRRCPHCGLEKWSEGETLHDAD
jgi:hypothetical protein